MQWTVGLIVIALLLALVVYFFLVVLIAIPLMLPLFAFGLFFGFVVGLVFAGGVLTGRLESDVCTPSAFARKRRPGPLPADDAWPEYFAAQVWWDAAATLEWSWGWIWSTARAAWALGRRRPRLRTVAVFAFPVSLPIAFGAIGVVIGVGLGLLLVFAVGAVVTGLAWLLGCIVVGVLTALDRLRVARHRSVAACPQCYHVTPVPAYRCDGHHDPETDWDDGLHFDVRPGRQGVWRRRCGCGRMLPTGVRRARRRLKPHCPLAGCGDPLHPDVGAATDLRIALLGAGSAGKTSVLAVLVHDLFEAGAAANQHVTAGNRSSRRRIGELRDDLAAGRQPVLTDPMIAPAGLVLHLESGRGSALLQLFDASGDHLADPERVNELAYLEYARALLFVVDPFALATVREQARQLRPDLLERARAATYATEQSYQDAAIMLRNVDATHRQRLAVVVTKTDLLRELPLGQELGHTSTEIRSWLVAQEEDNLVLAAERDFQRTRYFRCSGTVGPHPESPLAGVRWLLADEPFQVLAQRRGTSP